MSNIMYREIVWTYRWLRTFLPTIRWPNRPLIQIVRRGYRKQMTDNKVFVSLWSWLRGR